jgi:hypothetical protein
MWGTKDGLMGKSEVHHTKNLGAAGHPTRTNSMASEGFLINPDQTVIKGLK